MARSSVIEWLSRRRVAVIVTAVVVGVAVWGGVVLHAGEPRTPFPLARMHARVTLTVTTPAHTQAVVDRLGERRRLARFLLGRQQLVGQLRFRTVGTAGDGGQLALFVIDNRIGQPLGHVSGVGPKRNDVSEGRDGDYERLATKYHWLRSLAAVRIGSGYGAPGDSISFSPRMRGPVTFTAVISDGLLPLKTPAHELSFVLAYVGRQGVWAQRIPVSPARSTA